MESKGMALGATLKVAFRYHHKLFSSVRWYKKRHCKSCAGEYLTRRTRVHAHTQLSQALLSCRPNQWFTGCDFPHEQQHHRLGTC